MKLTNLALLVLGAIFGPNATSAADAITRVNDPLTLKRKLSSSDSEASSSTKSAKNSKATSYEVDYQATAALIVAGLGCEGKQCGDTCYTIDNEAVDALDVIAAGGSNDEAWMEIVEYGLGVCNSEETCISRNPSDGYGFALTEAIALFSGVQDECGGDEDLSVNEVMAAYGTAVAAGSVRQKNVKNIMLKNLLDARGGAIGFWTVGYAFAYGTESGARQNMFLQFAAAATAATIVAATVPENDSRQAYLDYSIFLTGFVYPVIVKGEFSLILPALILGLEAQIEARGVNVGWYKGLIYG